MLPLLIEFESDAIYWPNFPENRYKVRFQYVYKREYINWAKALHVVVDLHWTKGFQI